ncbi:hypothetical protein FOCC_FOCC008362 [Frankliniella occidentalis]|nr:hypothetical protein FOCC_FOCC008362 [Frankliniella occidentalis]
MASKRALKILEKALEKDGDVDDGIDEICVLTEARIRGLAQVQAMEKTRRWLNSQVNVPSSPAGGVLPGKPLVDYPISPSLTSASSRISVESRTPQKQSRSCSQQGSATLKHTAASKPDPQFILPANKPLNRVKQDLGKENTPLKKKTHTIATNVKEKEQVRVPNPDAVADCVLKANPFKDVNGAGLSVESRTPRKQSSLCSQQIATGKPSTASKSFSQSLLPAKPLNLVKQDFGKENKNLEIQTVNETTTVKEKTQVGGVCTADSTLKSNPSKDLNSAGTRKHLRNRNNKAMKYFEYVSGDEDEDANHSGASDRDEALEPDTSKGPLSPMSDLSDDEVNENGDDGLNSASIHPNIPAAEEPAKETSKAKNCSTRRFKTERTILSRNTGKAHVGSPGKVVKKRSCCPAAVSKPVLQSLLPAKPFNQVKEVLFKDNGTSKSDTKTGTNIKEQDLGKEKIPLEIQPDNETTNVTEKTQVRVPTPDIFADCELKSNPSEDLHGAGTRKNLRKRKAMTYCEDASGDEEELFKGCGASDADGDETWEPNTSKGPLSPMSDQSDDAVNEHDNDGTPSEPIHPNNPAAEEPPATEPPATEPPATEPPATEPPATEPPATEPAGVAKKCSTRRSRAEVTKLRNCGKTYVGTTGKVVKKRSCRPLPICKAKWCQIGSLSEEDRQQLFSEYWGLSSHNKRCQYISSRVLKKEKNSTKVRSSPKKERTCTLEYSVVHNEKRFLLSKECFLSTLDENDRFVRGIVERRSTTAQVPDDRRGRHAPPNKIPDEVKQEVEAHIKKFPAYVSHYSRRHTEQLYLGSHLNVSIMYNMYLKEGGTKLSYNKYLEIFNNMSPRLKFKTPKVDTCVTCDTLQNGIKAAQSTEETDTLQQQLQLHVSEADFAYDCKKEDKLSAINSDKTISTIVFDLEQVLPCPYLTSGNVFYLRQLSVYNLTVFATETKEAFNFMWHEAIAGRGAEEIASCLLSYFNEFLPSTVKHVILYSDTCSGQNKNSLMITALSFTVQHHPTVETIDQKFLVSGHTHLECDQAHHQIEQKKKKTNVPLHHPQNYFDLVREVGPTNKKFKVKEMKLTDFWNFEKALVGNEAPLVWRKRNTDGNPFLFGDAEWFRFQKKCPGIIQYKKSLHKEEPFAKLNWKRNKKEDLPEIEIFQKSRRPSPISSAKKKDLLSLLDQINPLYHDFYSNLTTDENLPDEDPDLPPEFNVAELPSTPFQFNDTL